MSLPSVTSLISKQSPLCIDSSQQYSCFQNFKVFLLSTFWTPLKSFFLNVSSPRDHNYFQSLLLRTLVILTLSLIVSLSIYFKYRGYNTLSNLSFPPWECLSFTLSGLCNELQARPIKVSVHYNNFKIHQKVEEILPAIRLNKTCQLVLPEYIKSLYNVAPSINSIPIECHYDNTIGEPVDAYLESRFDTHEKSREPLSLKNPDPRTVFALINSESPDRFMRLNNVFLMSNFDVIADYRKFADVHWEFHDPRFFQEFDFESLFQPSQYSDVVKSDTIFGSMVVSNCIDAKNNRTEILKDISQQIPVASFGKCLHNTNFKDLGCEFDSFFDTKVCGLSKYLFNFCLENSNVYNYVSEKVINAFQAYTIPVYLGASNVHEILPNPNAAIYVDDFESIDDLVTYLKCVKDSPDIIQDYLDWRLKPINPEFISRFGKRFFNQGCELCSAIGSAVLRRRHLYDHLSTKGKVSVQDINSMLINKDERLKLVNYHVHPNTRIKPSNRCYTQIYG